MRGLTFFDGSLNSPLRIMVNILKPVVRADTATYVKVANYPGLYRHSRSGRYYACKKLHGVRRERSLETCDRKIAERRLKEWVGNLEKVDAEVEKTTLEELIERYHAVTASLSESSRATDRSIIKKFLAWWPHGRDCQVRQIRPSMLDEWLAHEAPRLRNVSYNGYTGFLKQLFSIAVKDRIIAESPAASLRVPWKKPQTPKRLVPTVEQFEAIVESVRSQQYADTAQESGDFIEFLGLAGVGQAEASSLTWGDIDWSRNRMYFRRHKTDTHFYVPIYVHLRPLLMRLKEQARGRASDSARVFKVKDAKKALSAACARLNLPHFSQRNLRQSLIRRLIRAKVDVKSISKWQGHQDGGQLILDTYTEVWVLNELLDSLGWLTPCIHPLLPLARAHQETTGAVFVVNGNLNCADLYATPALFQQIWPKLLWAMTVEAVVDAVHLGGIRRSVGEGSSDGAGRQRAGEKAGGTGTRQSGKRGPEIRRSEGE